MQEIRLFSLCVRRLSFGKWQELPKNFKNKVWNFSWYKHRQAIHKMHVLKPHNSGLIPYPTLSNLWRNLFQSNVVNIFYLPIHFGVLRCSPKLWYIIHLWTYMTCSNIFTSIWFLWGLKCLKPLSETSTDLCVYFKFFKVYVGFTGFPQMTLYILSWK